jgi:hypothetical protein
MRRSVALLALLPAALAACADESHTLAPRTGPLALRVVADIGLAGRQLDVRVDYRRTDGTRPVLLTQRFTVDTGRTQLPVTVDVGPCVRDAQRDTAGVRGVAGCPLFVTLTLRDAQGQPIDSAGAGPIAAAGGDTVAAPSLVLRRTASLVPSASAVDLLVGQTQAVTVRALDASGQPVSNRTVSWTSADARVATVGADGTVRAVAPGRTTVTAAREDVSASVTVTVPAVRAMTVTPANPSIIQTGSQRLTAAATLESGFTTRFLWRTSDPAVATVDTLGTVTAVAPGAVTITALASIDTVRRVSTTVRVTPFQAVARWVTTRVLDPGPVPDNFNGFWGLGPNEVYTAASGVIARWDGTAWTRLNTGTAVNTCCARAVSGSSRTNIVFVGFNGMLLRYDGAQFTRDPSGTTLVFNAVWVASPSFAVAVGDSGVVSTWDGQRWQTGKLGAQPFLAVWGASATDVWAGGASGTLYHFDGTRWTAQPPLPVAGNVQSLWGADAAAVYATVWNPSTNRSTVLRWSGTAWGAVSVPQEVTFNPAFVFGSGRGDVYVTAGWTTSHFDGAAWSNLPALPIDMWYTGLIGGWATPGRAFIGGYNGNAFEWQGNAWRTTNQSPGYRRAWASDARNVFAVGLWGIIDRYDGTRWTAMSSGTTVTLNGVWGSAANDVYAVGSQGTILHYDGATWTRVSGVPSAEYLQAAWGAGPRDLWVVGSNGTALHFDGSTWRPTSTGTNAVLNNVFGVGPNDVFAVGDGGTIVHWDGTAWRRMASPVTDQLQGLWGTSPNNVYAGGGNGTLMRWDGASWSIVQRTMRANTYQAIAGRGPNDVYALGCGGESTPRLHFDGTTWTQMDPSGCETSIVVFPTEGAWATYPFRIMVRGEGPRGTVGFSRATP